MHPIPPMQLKRLPGPASVNEMIRCEHCGTLQEDGTKFCTECGAKLPAPVPPAAGYAQQSAAPQQPVYPQQFNAPPPPAAPQVPVYPQQSADTQQNVYARPAAAPQQPVYPSPQAAPYPYGTQSAAPRAATLKEFLQLPENKKLKRQINGAAIICYICAAITFGLMAAAEQPSMLLDVAVVLILGLLIHITKSKICAIILMAFAVINTIIVLIATQQFGGWLLLVAGACAVSATSRLDKLWKAYQQQN